MACSHWRLPSLTGPYLPADAVHVWRAPLSVPPQEAERLHDLLSPDERGRALRFRFPRDRDAYVGARGRLRVLLGRYLGIAPEAIAFQYGPFGKPSVVNEQGLQFNLSHAGDHLLFGITRGRQIGVDIEPVRLLPDADQIAERFFSPHEAAAYAALPPEVRPEAFFWIWTQKEALVKALGDGLTHPLDTFDVSTAPEAPMNLLSLRGGEVRDWALEAVRVAPGVIGAIASTAPPWALTCWEGAEIMSAVTRRSLTASAA